MCQSTVGTGSLSARYTSKINSDSIVKGRQSGHVIGGVAAIPYRAICTMCMQSVLDLRYDLSLSICDRFATEDAIHADARVSSYA